MRKLLSAAALVLIAVATGLAHSSHPRSGGPSGPPADGLKPVGSGEWDSALAHRDEQKSVWDGVYTAEQAKRGERLYAQHCAACHGADLEGVGIIPPLAGSGYIKGWDGKTVGDMVEHQQKTMPTDDPKKLTRQQHVDVLAYLLSVNRFPAGADELPREAERLSAIRFESTRPKK